jgi:hypothetical protein
MRELKKLDKVAYVRFASVYRSFEDVDEVARGDPGDRARPERQRLSGCRLRQPRSPPRLRFLLRAGGALSAPGPAPPAGPGRSTCRV